MKIQLFALSALALGAVALAVPVRPVLAPSDVLLTSVPGFGPSRVETVSYCLNDAGVDRYEDLGTDTEVERFGRCMTDLT
jgi:hypothetical protein